MLILPAILAILTAILEITKLVLAGQTPEVRAEIWRRYLAETEWMHKLLAKFSDQLEKQIDKEIPVPTPPKPKVSR